MYAIHTTPGFVLEARPRGEAGKTLSIFTRDLGLIFAVAEGIRLERSKLRYHAQEHSFGTFSLVRGREVWRLTSAVGAKQGDRVGKELIARIALLLRRLVRGEEAHPKLFDILEECARFLGSCPDLPSDELQTLESLTVMRILNALGYVSTDDSFASYVASPSLSRAFIEQVSSSRAVMNKHINRAIRESHL